MNEPHRKMEGRHPDGRYYKKPKQAAPDFDSLSGEMAVRSRWDKQGRSMTPRNIRRRKRAAEIKAEKIAAERPPEVLTTLKQHLKHQREVARMERREAWRKFGDG